MSTTATRLITLIMLLQSQPNQKGADLAKKLDVSVRTLHRYINRLDEMGIPVYSERGPYGGFSLVRGYKMPPLVLTPDEAVAVYLGTSLVAEMWGRIYQDAAAGALSKLDNLLPEEQRHEIGWAQRTLIATGMNRADISKQAPTLEMVRQAVREQRKVEILYRSPGRPKPTHRVVDPYALVHRWGWWYVIGYCHLRQAVRSFRVDRIQEIKIKNDQFQPRSEFDIHAYLENEFRSQSQIIARLRFSPEAVPVIQENPMFLGEPKRLADGSVEVGLNVPDLKWATSLVLSFGPLVLVLDPPELRDLVHDWAQATADRYRREYGVEGHVKDIS